MKTFLWVALLTFNIKFIKGREKCCPNLKCLSVDKPWLSVERLVPDPRCDVGVRVYLFTRDNQDTPHEVKMWPNVETRNSPYDPRKKITVYIHGWGDCGLCSHSQDMKKAILKAEDVNMLLLDYSAISKEGYEHIVSDIRVVASVLARLLKTLIKRHKARSTDMHLIGHSLGAHIAGYAAREIQNVHRITGLDPAGALFSDYGEEVRLNKNDANFVDIAHTYANPFIPLGGVGILFSIGHVDYYFNGGWIQPGCIKEANQEAAKLLTHVQQEGKETAVLDFFACPHVRAIYYYAEAVVSQRNCTFWGIKRQNQPMLKSISFGQWESELSSCTLDTCSPWGLQDIDYPARGSFDVRTTDGPTFCKPRSDVQKHMGSRLENFKLRNWMANIFNFIKNIFKWS